MVTLMYFFKIICKLIFYINISLKNVNFSTYTHYLSVENVIIAVVLPIRRRVLTRYVLDADDPTLFPFVGKDSKDVQLSLHDIGTVVL